MMLLSFVCVRSLGPVYRFLSSNLICGTLSSIACISFPTLTCIHETGGASSGDVSSGASSGDVSSGSSDAMVDAFFCARLFGATLHTVVPFCTTTPYTTGTRRYPDLSLLRSGAVHKKSVS